MSKNQALCGVLALCLLPRLSPVSFLLLHFLADCFLSTWTSDGEPFSALISWCSGTSFQPGPHRRARTSFCSFFYPLHRTQPDWHCHLPATFLRKGPKVPQGTSLLLPHNRSLLSENCSSVPHLNYNAGLRSNQRGCN